MCVYERAGLDNDDDDNQPPVLLLSGAFLSSRAWLRLAPLLSGRRLLAVDLVGVGRTSRARAPRDIALSAQAALLADLLSALDLPLVDVVGASYGGCVGLILAGTQPTLVRSLAAIEAPILAKNHAWLHTIRRGLEWLRFGRPAFWLLIKSGLLARLWTNDLLGRRRSTAPDQKKHTVFQCLYDPYARLGNWKAFLHAPIDDPMRALAAIRAPLLFIEGSESPLRPEFDRTHDLMSHIHPTLSWQSIAFAQHDAAIQLPGLVADSIRQFWQSLPI